MKQQLQMIWTKPGHCLRRQWRHKPSQLQDATDVCHDNAKKFTPSEREWDRNHFEIHDSALEHSSNIDFVMYKD